MTGVLRQLRNLVMTGSLFLGTLPGMAAATADQTARTSASKATLGAPDTASVVSRVARNWLKAQWTAYRASFVSADGRVVDNANGGVSHSEGQGYGLLLAVMSDDEEGFALIWRWTRSHLQIRPDGLFAWKWDPKLNDVADRNDATDGDLLIAWALVKAAKRFNRPEYDTAARRIAEAVAAGAVRLNGMGPVLLPGLAGFGTEDQPDGPVVNPSYWVFPALRDFDALWPKGPWRGLRRSGFKLLEAGRFGPLALPANWVALSGPKPVPARNFPALFGYDAIRIPLYVAWDGDAPPALLAGFARFSPKSDPSVIEVATGSAGETMGGTGYRAVIALARCAARGETIPPELMTARDPLYYSETLRLLSISVIQERYSQCL